MTETGSPQAKRLMLRNTGLRTWSFTEHKTCCAAIAGSWAVCVLLFVGSRHGDLTYKAGLGLGQRGSGTTLAVSAAIRPACKGFNTGWRLPAKPVKDTCATVPVQTVRIDNPEFSICARTKSNVVDNLVISNKGYWPDCGDILKLLEEGGGQVLQHNPSIAKQASKGLLVDVGANIGACAIWMAARGYDVVAFEPKPIHIAMLKASAALRPDVGRRITLHEMGLSDEPTAGAILVSEDSNSGNSWIFKPSQEADVSVQGIGGAPGSTVSSDSGVSLGRLDDFCRQTIDVLKVDTQGFEGHVFRGAAGLMRSGYIKRIKFEFWPFGLRSHGSDPVQMLSFLAQVGYTLKIGGKILLPAEFGPLTDRLCASNDVPDCANQFMDINGVWEGTQGV